MDIESISFISHLASDDRLILSNNIIHSHSRTSLSVSVPLLFTKHDPVTFSVAVRTKLSLYLSVSQRCAALCGIIELNSVECITQNFYSYDTKTMDPREIYKQSNEYKKDFISSVIVQEIIPSNFKLLPRSKCREDQIFFSHVNGEKTRREWLHYTGNTFYCVYCLCYSNRNDIGKT